MTLQKQTFDKIRQIVDRFPSELELACEEIDANTMLVKTELDTDEVEKDDSSGVSFPDFGQSPHLSSPGSLIVFTVWESWKEFDRVTLEKNAKLDEPNEFLEDNIKAFAPYLNGEDRPILEIEDQFESHGLSLLHFVNGDHSYIDEEITSTMFTVLYDSGFLAGKPILTSTDARPDEYFLLDGRPIQLDWSKG